MAAKLREQQLAIHRQDAKHWLDRLRKEGHIPLILLCNRLIEFKNKALFAFEQLNTIYEDQKHEAALNEYITKLTEVKGVLRDELDTSSQYILDTIDKSQTCLDEFDALKEGTKASLMRALTDSNYDLAYIEEDTKKFLLQHHVEKIAVLNTVNSIELRIVKKQLFLLQQRQIPLEKRMERMEILVSASVLTEVEQIMGRHESLFNHCKGIAQQQAATMRQCERLLAWKNLRILNEKENREKFAQNIEERRLTGARIHTSLSFCYAAHSVLYRLRLLLLLGNHYNGLQQSESLQAWLQRVNTLIICGFSNTYKSVKTFDEMEEALLSDKKSPQALSIKPRSKEDLSLLSQLAAQVLEQLETLHRHCVTCAGEYEKLGGVVKQKEMIPVLKTLAEAVEIVIHGHRLVAQFRANALQKMEDSESFLPSNMVARRQSQEAASRASIFPEDMHETSDGLIIGTITEEGRLERLGIKGEVTASYLKDDSGHWIQDYEAATSTSQTVKRVSISHSDTSRSGANETAPTTESVQRADMIADASLQSAVQTRAEAEAVDASDADYPRKLDLKIELMRKAVSRQNAHIRQLSGIIGHLALLPAQVRGKEAEASIENLLSMLKERKKDLECLLEQVTKEQNIHARKIRDPNSADFVFLLQNDQIQSVRREFQRSPNRAKGKEKDWLDRYTVFIKPDPEGKTYAPWIVHAHFDSNATDSLPLLVHMKRDEEKDWGSDKDAYHSFPLSLRTFERVKEEAQKSAFQEERRHKEKGKKPAGSSKAASRRWH